MLLAVDLHKDFIDVEGVTKSAMSPLQSPGIFGSEFDTPETDRFAADDNTPFG